jgi:Uma2 family endonuclease
LQKAHLEGAPDLAIEIVSADSGSRDWRDKRREYERYGVREYWIIDPLERRLEVFAQGPSRRYRRLRPHDGWLASTVVPGLALKANWLFQDPLPSKAWVLQQVDANYKV